MKGILLVFLLHLKIHVLPYKPFFRSVVKNLKEQKKNEKFNLGAITIAKKSTDRIIRNSPLKINCFIRAIILNKLLSNLGEDSIIRFSVKKENQMLSGAHAYIFLNENIQFYRIKDYVDINI